MNHQNPYAWGLQLVYAFAANSVQPFDRSDFPQKPWLLSADSSGSGNGEDRTVRAGRRRPTTPGSGDRRRADTPIRRRPGQTEASRPTDSSGGGTDLSGSGETGAGGGGLPQLPLGNLLGGKKLTGGVSVLLLIAIVVIYMFFSGQLNTGQSPDSSYQEPAPTDDTQSLGLPTDTTIVLPPTVKPASTKPTATSKPVSPGSVSTAKGTWLVMLYQDADDKILEEDIYTDLNEAERVGSSERVKIVAQIDRYDGGYSGDGDWTSARRYYLNQDDDLKRINSKMLADLGEVNMANSKTLVDFVTWAMKSYPADKYVLILSDHGMGWPGGWTDSDPGSDYVSSSNIPLVSRLGDQIYSNELDAALGQIRSQMGLDKFDLIGMDACLMSHLEVLAALQPHTRFAVASQETEPALGWAYTGFLSQLKNNPDMSSDELSKQIVDTYITDDQRIVDDQARQEFLRQGSPLGGLFGSGSSMSAAQLTRQLEQTITLTAIDMELLPNLMDRVNDLAFIMQKVDQAEVARARNYAQSFTSVFGRDLPPSYLDLGNLVQIIQKEIPDANLSSAAGRVLNALNEAVIAEKHGPKKPGANGISIYFPNSQMYENPIVGARSYTAIADRFAGDSLWDEFLAFHYSGRTFKQDSRAVVLPDSGSVVRGPGAGKIELIPIKLSSNVAAPGQPVLLSTRVQGQNIGYIYLFVGFLDQASNSILIADTDYLESGTTKEVSGVYYPDWGEGAFNLEFEWEPLMFAITDGTNSVTALLTPESYGVSKEEASYTVDGIYKDAQGGETRNARLYFVNGILRQVFGFTGQDANGSPAEIIPQPGDTFTIQEKWLDLDSQGGVQQVAYQEGGTLTFGDQMFQWEELDVAVGEYIVGFIVQDLDGNPNEIYTRVSVK